MDLSRQLIYNHKKLIDSKRKLNFIRRMKKMNQLMERKICRMNERTSEIEKKKEQDRLILKLYGEQAKVQLERTLSFVRIQSLSIDIYMVA